MEPQQSEALTHVLPCATQHCWTLLVLSAQTSVPQQSPDEVQADPVVLHVGAVEQVPLAPQERPVQQSEGWLHVEPTVPQVVVAWHVPDVQSRPAQQSPTEAHEAPL